MSIPIELLNWLDYKYHDDCDTVYESKVLSHEFKRHTGGRIIFAGITIGVEPCDTFKLVVSDSINIIEDSFLLGAKDGIISTLFTAGDKPILKLKITIHEFNTSEVDSSYMAFQIVAKETMGMLLE